MEEIRIGMRFKNRANKRIAYVAQIDGVGKCADLMYEVVEEGQSKGARSSLAGLKAQKSWSYIKEDAQQEEPEAVEESTASDGTPFAQVMEEIKQDEAVAVEKKKAEKKQKPAKEKKAPKEKKPKATAEDKLSKLREIIDLIEKSELDLKVNEKKFMVAVFVGKKRMAEFFVQSHRLCVWCRDVVAEPFTESHSPVFHPSCGMKYQFQIADCNEVKAVLKTIKEV